LTREACEKLAPEKSDHDFLLELHQAVYGVNGQGGLVREVHSINLSLSGNPNAISFEDKMGVAGTLRLHIKQDKDGKRRLWAFITLLITTASAVSHYLLDLILKP
jgi:hypothetical protein